MAFSQSNQKLESYGSRRMEKGNWDATAVSTGEFTTQLNIVDRLHITVNSATASQGAYTVEESFPLKGAITVNFAASGLTGTYEAVGEA